MIVTGVTVAAKLAFLKGEFKPEDNWMLALYTSEAGIGPDTPSYTQAGETSGKGYRAGGLPLKNCRVWEDNGAACMTFDSPTIPVATLTARGFMIYNATRGGKSLFVGDWGGDYTSTEGPFNIRIANDQVVFD